jgi:hypothetical protein
MAQRIKPWERRKPSATGQLLTFQKPIQAVVEVVLQLKQEFPYNSVKLRDADAKVPLHAY